MVRTLSYLCEESCNGRRAVQLAAAAAAAQPTRKALGRAARRARSLVVPRDRQAMWGQVRGGGSLGEKSVGTRSVVRVGLLERDCLGQLLSVLHGNVECDFVDGCRMGFLSCFDVTSQIMYIQPSKLKRGDCSPSSSTTFWCLVPGHCP